MTDVIADHNGDLMDRIYRYQRHIYDLTRKFYLLGRDELIRALDPSLRGHVLEVGCGTGRNLIAAAQAYPLTRFYGLDISAEMLETARANIVRAGLSDRILLARGDATQFDAAALFGQPTYDRVFFSYALSMVPDWRAAVEAGMHVLAPGGRLHVVDFGQQERLPRAFRAVLFAWLRRFHVAPRAELPQVLADLAEAEGAAHRFRPLYRGYAWSAEIRAL